MKLVILVVIVCVGLLVTWLYLWKPVPIPAALGGPRPWRRLGAAICLVMAVMFVVGVEFLDEYRTPRVGLAYWCVILMLALWVCLLAWKDMRYTRRILAQRRARRASGDGGVENEASKKETNG